MTSRDFAFWLQGFFEISRPETIGKEQTEMIQRHLNLVFKHEIDPAMGDENHQQILNKIHNHNHKPVQTTKFPQTEAEAVEYFGPKPSPKHEFNLHGWYNPDEGVPRC